MEKMLSVFKWIKKQLTLLKKKAMELLSREKFKEMLDAVEKNKTIKIVLKNGDTHSLEQIIFRGDKSHVLADNHGIPTAYTFKEIQSIEIGD